MRLGSVRGPALAAVVALAAALAAPALAATATNPLVGIPNSTPTSTAPVTSAVTTATTTSASSGGGLTTFDVVAIGVVTIAVFAGIIITIRSDALRHTPRGGAAIGIDRERGTVTPRADRVRRSRARAKAARRARRTGR